MFHKQNEFLIAFHMSVFSSEIVGKIEYEISARSVIEPLIFW